MSVEVECAHCGNKKLAQVPGVWTPLALNEKSQPVPGPAVPVVMLGCPTCGFIQLFSPQAIKPKPFPERPAEQAKAEAKGETKDA